MSQRFRASAHVMFAAILLGAGLASGFAARAEPAATQQKTVTVFAAASLRNVLDAVAQTVGTEGQARPVVSLAASSALAKQIEQGAPADVFISADEDWMNYLADKDLILPETRRDIATNTLVLIAPAASTVSVDLKEGVDLAALLGDGRLAVADVAAVPAGKYAKAALKSLNAWDGVADKLAQSENVRAALAFVARGEAPLGIVYGSDAKADTNVRVVAEFSKASHPKIVYPAAVVKSSPRVDEARAFIARLTSDAGRAAFAAEGFNAIQQGH